MEIQRVRALRGPNIWSRNACLEAWVDLGPLKDSSSEVIPGFNERLMGWLPGLIEHRCSIGERGGFLVRLRRGTYLAHILEHVTLEIQTMAGTPVGFGRARETSCEGLYKVAIRYADETVGRACLEVAHRLCLAAVYDLPFNMAAEVKAMRELADRVCLGPSTTSIVDAARARNIPSRRLNSGSLVQLGYGNRQRRIWTAETDSTSAIAESIAQDKDLTKSLLTSAGVPVPEGRQVESPEDAWEAAEEIGVPVVVKPIDANHGRGVFMDLSSRDQVMRAYGEALKEGSGVIVERFAPGSEHRLLVVGGKLVAASRGDAACIEGDGQRTVVQLIADQVNSDPRRGEDEIYPLNLVDVKAPNVVSLIEQQGYHLDSVPPAGVQVIVARNDNLSIDVTDQVHPINAEHAVLAAKVVGLDIAGIDLVALDISQPLEEQGGVIVEVNAGPGLLMHLKPSVGQPRPVGEAIVETLFPAGETGRIPLVCVTGTNGKTTTTRLVSSILRQAGYHVGVACSDGVLVDQRVIEIGDCAGPKSARNVLLNPLVDAAVFEAGRGGILREGLGFDKCDVAVVTNIGHGDHLGEYFIESTERMFSVKRTPVDVVLPTGYAVLNAADPLVAEMASLSAGGVIFFARDPDNPVITAHRQQGKKAVFVRDGMLSIGDGDTESPLVSLADIPCTHGGRVPFQIENVLAATAAAVGLRLSYPTIIAGLQLFRGNLQDDPARFNVFELGGKTLIVCDARNRSALEAVIEALPAFPHEGRRVVYSAEADRRDEDFVDQGRLLGQAFSSIYLCEIDASGKRPAGDVTRLLEEGIDAVGTSPAVVRESDWSLAVDRAWHDFSRGEVLVLQSSSIGQTVRKVQHLLGLDRLEIPSGVRNP